MFLIAVAVAARVPRGAARRAVHGAPVRAGCCGDDSSYYWTEDLTPAQAEMLNNAYVTLAPESDPTRESHLTYLLENNMTLTVHAQSHATATHAFTAPAGGLPGAASEGAPTNFSIGGNRNQAVYDQHAWVPSAAIARVYADECPHHSPATPPPPPNPPPPPPPATASISAPPTPCTTARAGAPAQRAARAQDVGARARAPAHDGALAHRGVPHRDAALVHLVAERRDPARGPRRGDRGRRGCGSAPSSRPCNASVERGRRGWPREDGGRGVGACVSCMRVVIVQRWRLLLKPPHAPTRTPAAHGASGPLGRQRPTGGAVVVLCVLYHLVLVLRGPDARAGPQAVVVAQVLERVEVALGRAAAQTSVLHGLGLGQVRVRKKTSTSIWPREAASRQSSVPDAQPSLVETHSRSHLITSMWPLRAAEPVHRGAFPGWACGRFHRPLDEVEVPALGGAAERRASSKSACCARA